MSVTQKNIAERLGISPSLVGRALAGHPEVAAKTRERVAEAAREMGYDANTNSAARALIARRYGQKVKKGLIAVTFPPHELSTLRYTPFFAPIIEAMETEASHHGTELYFCSLRENELPVLVREHGVDGIILLGSSSAGISAIAQANAIDVPSITVHWRCNGARSVSPNDRDGARQATRYLIEQGHRRIAFLGVHGLKGEPVPRHESALSNQNFASLASIQRLHGYLDAMGEYGLPVEEEWIEDSLPLRSVTGAYCTGCGNCASCSGWSMLMEQNKVRPGSRELPFTALICQNDLVAMGAITRAKEDGFDVPRDLSVIGFDHTSPEFEFHPEVTSVSFCRDMMGRLAVQLLSEVVDQKTSSEETALWHRVLAAELLIGESTGAVNADNHSASAELRSPDKTSGWGALVTSQ